MALERELATYKSKLAELSADEGRYVLIHAEDVIDTFGTYEDAIKTGYLQFGLDSFFVKEIHALEQALFISRLVVSIPAESAL